MYVPKQFNDLDKEGIIAFIKEYSFGILVSAEDNVPVATHLPFAVSIAEDGRIVLTSHLAKANGQASQLDGKRVLVIFSEPHAYISPKHYESKQSVPTWNYVAVHTYGNATILSEETEVMRVLEEMIDTYEQDYRQQWAELSADYKSRMAKGIVAFRIVVEKINAVNKLSQNKQRAERERIIADLKTSGDSAAVAIADRMEDNGKS